MNYLSFASVVLAIFGLIAGLCAAYQWLKASKIEVDPGFRSGSVRSAAEAMMPGEPGDSLTSTMYWTTANMVAFTQSAHLNAIAARLTALAVFVGGISSVLGVLGSYLR